MGVVFTLKSPLGPAPFGHILYELGVLLEEIMEDILDSLGGDPMEDAELLVSDGQFVADTSKGEVLL